MKSQRLIALACAAIAAGYSVLWFSLQNLPLNDLPNHSARGLVMADLLFRQGLTFGGLFELRLGFEPYILGDLLIAALMQWLPADVAGRIVLWLCFFALPASVYLYARILRLSAAACLAAALVAAFVAADITFLIGFVGFRLSLALLFVAMYFATRVLDEARMALYAGYAASVVMGYLMHLAMPVLLGATLGGLLAARRPWRSGAPGAELARGMALLAVPVILFAAHSVYSPPEAAPMIWPPLAQKIRYALGFFSPIDKSLGYGLLLVYLLCLVPGLALLVRRGRSTPAEVTAVVALASTALYLVLPRSQGLIVDIDARALPVVFIFAALAGIASADAAPLRAGAWQAFGTAAAVALATLNLLVLWQPMQLADRRLGSVREVIAALPPGARVLPIFTEGRPGYYMLLHAGEFAVMDRAAFTPYLFSGDRGFPQVYFRYLNRPYAPPDHWVVRGQSVDWPRLREAWQYLLVVGPVEALSIPYPVVQVRANGNATLLRFAP